MSQPRTWDLDAGHEEDTCRVYVSDDCVEYEYASFPRRHISYSSLEEFIENRASGSVVREKLKQEMKPAQVLEVEEEVRLRLSEKEAKQIEAGKVHRQRKWWELRK